MEIDNATRAQVLREFASATLDDRIAQWLRDTADSYDPPRPQIEPGTLCEAWHLKHGTVCGYYHIGTGGVGELRATKSGSSALFTENSISTIRPVRIVEDDND